MTRTSSPSPTSGAGAKLARAAAARAKGRRFGTICCRSRGYRNLVPDLRISGRWLQRAGFDLGQNYEIEIRAGRLTIRAV
ncbi:MAG TPA: SymE family type I addiction module toxin [Thermoanaerobaculia bacterium]|nr:SymE family type I addiction module toxin [Thermoanaerobaculia bacterium]